ncbi:MAG: hypothetical protein B7Z75_13715 [Acidocella sp. 20-57-95]|nr:MAG: hypothetical protein B7Z75_13715 [Acidocella sp. 20-57-95]
MSDAKLKPSDEATARQIDLAKQEGALYQRALKYMIEKVADGGDAKRAGDYLVGYAQERAEGMYVLKGEGRLEWTEPTDENCHLEVAVTDALDQRFIPGLKIEATLTPEGGTPIGPFEVPFLWHPGLYHYGRSVKVPGGGKYDLKIKIAPPDFMRHDKVNGKRYAETVEVEFSGITITPGQE